MKKSKSFALIATVAFVASGGEFRTKFNGSESVTLTIPRPADAIVKAKSLALQYQSSQPKFLRGPQLTQFVQQEISKEFDFANSNPDATLKIAVSAYEPVAISEETKMEQRTINTGTSEKPNYQARSVPVVYRSVHGALTAGLLMTDKANQQLDSFTAGTEINRTEEVTVNGQAPNASPTTGNSGSWNPFGQIKKPVLNQKKPEGPKIVTAEGLETQMVQELAVKIQKRYISSSDKVDILLAVDPELKMGDKLAESGQWKEALDSWTSADMKKNPADRLYNMAVAKEALAYADYAHDSNLDDFLPKFQEAMDLYSKALHSDPGEKYMRQAVERLELAKNNIDNVRKIQVEQQEQTARAAKQAVEQAKVAKLRDAAIKDKAPDSPEEASFRADVRTELGGVTGDLIDAKRDHLIALGQKLGLSELKSDRVVLQEIDRKKQVGQSLSDYEDLFKPLAADGKITSPERARLKALARKLDLEPAEVKTVEDKYQFEEASGLKTSKPVVRKTRTAASSTGSPSSSIQQ